MDRIDRIGQSLETAIAIENAQASRIEVIGVVIMFCSILPLACLAWCLLTIIPDHAGAWLIIGVVVTGLSTCIAVWHIGGHVAKLAASHRRRALQLHDLQLYLMSVPEEKWPAKEMLKYLTRREYSFGAVVEGESNATSEGEVEDT